MDEFRKISTQIESQFPEFIRQDGPNFVAFLKAYFEYMEKTGNAIDRSRGLHDTMDIDRTLDEFVEYFQREFMLNIPRSALVDKRLVAKHIRNFYRSRGSQDSYRFLFRILFDEEIDFYYPGEDILRASDGRWIQETVIRGVTNQGNALNLDGKQIQGLTSGATARVQEILQINASGLDLYQLVVENVIGRFQEDEIVTDGFGTSIRIFNNVGSIQNVRITQGGAFHQKGDSIRLTGLNGGSALGTVTGTTDTSGVIFRIINGGSGYRVGNTIIQISGGSPTKPAQFAVVSVNPVETLQLSDLIDPVKNVPLNSVPFGAGLTKFAASNINTVLSSAFTFYNVTVGSIDSIRMIDSGSGYTGSLPSATAIDTEISALNIADATWGGFKGRNAVIVASRAYGAISSVSITSSDINFLKNDPISITNVTRASDSDVTETNIDVASGTSYTRKTIRSATYPATVTAEIFGTFSLSGRYTDTKGFISWNNKLQDNEFYQEYSYVIRGRKMLEEYKNVVMSLVHPAGTKMFAMTQSDQTADVSSLEGDSGVYIYKKSPNEFTITDVTTKTLTTTQTPFWYLNRQIQQAGPTNLLIRSNQFSTIPPWNIANIPNYVQNAVAPDGTITAWTMSSATAGSAIVGSTQTLTTGPARYVFSLHVKNPSSGWFRIGLGPDSLATNRNAWFNISSGTLGTVDSGGGTTAGIQSLPDAWYRIWISTVLTETTSTLCYIRLSDTNGTTLSTFGTTALVYGAQFEVGSTPTQYIPTTTTPITIPLDNNSPGSNLAVIFPDQQRLRISMNGFGVLYGEDNEAVLMEDGDSFIYEPAEDKDEVLVAENGDYIIFNEVDAVTPRLFSDGLYTVNAIPSSSSITLRARIQPTDIEQAILFEDESMMVDESSAPLLLEVNNIENANGVFYYFRSYVGSI